MIIVTTVAAAVVVVVVADVNFNGVQDSVDQVYDFVGRAETITYINNNNYCCG